MTKRVILSVLLLLAPFIILSGSQVGKYKPAVADGNPIPPLPPNSPNSSAIANTSVA